jgi:hypothetical protein
MESLCQSKNITNAWLQKHPFPPIPRQSQPLAGFDGENFGLSHAELMALAIP